MQGTKSHRHSDINSAEIRQLRQSTGMQVRPWVEVVPVGWVNSVSCSRVQPLSSLTHAINWQNPTAPVAPEILSPSSQMPLNLVLFSHYSISSGVVLHTALRISCSSQLNLGLALCCQPEPPKLASSLCQSLLHDSQCVSLLSVQCVPTTVLAEFLPLCPLCPPNICHCAYCDC